ncbi:hypothetical protein F2Q68_00039355 [Brassica cretica]|uniref:Uncharacterized protein n=1 Tax=Brassica cretica TaxID=69181 RepID=A0A8S9MSB3_BRACR|nr:hypothetical protein F2Q68_00039355 [Brassica cretica]
MIDRDWDPGSQRKIGDRGDLWLRGRESKSNSSIGDSYFDSLAITLRGNPRAFHRLGRRIAVVRKWLLLGSFIWMQYPEDQSFGLQGMGFGIIETGSFASILESVVEKSVGQVRLFHIRKYGRLAYSRKLPFCPEAGPEAVVGAGFSYHRSLEDGVLPEAWRIIIQTGAALSQHASLRQDIAPVIPFSRLRLWPGPCWSLEESRLSLRFMLRACNLEPWVILDDEVLLFGGLDPCTQDRIDIGFKARTILFGLIQDLSRRFLHESLLVFCRPGSGSWFRGLQRCTRDTLIDHSMEEILYIHGSGGLLSSARFLRLYLPRARTDQSSNLSAFPASFVGGCMRPRRLFADPFSSSVPSWGNFLEADEAAPMAPLRQRRSLLPDDDGPCSKIHRGMNEMAIFEAYLEAGFRGFIPSLIAEVSAWFGFAPSQLTSLSWRTLIAIRVLGEFHDGRPLVDELSSGAGGIYPFGDLWDMRYVIMKMNRACVYPLFLVFDVFCPVSFAGEALVKLAMEIPKRFRWVPFLTRSALRLPISSVYDDYHKAKTWRTHPHPPSIPMIDSPADSSSPLSTALSMSSRGNIAVGPRQRSMGGDRRRLHDKILLLRDQIRDLMIQKELAIQRTRVSTRWELMKEWLEKNADHWNPEEEYYRYLLVAGGGGPLGDFPSTASTASPPSVTGPRQ